MIFLTNLVIIESPPFYFSEVIDDVRINEGGDLSRDVLITVTIDDNLVHVC